MRAPIGDFSDVRPAGEALDLLPDPVAAAVRHWAGPVPVEQVVFVDTAPDKADTADFVAAYGTGLLPFSANCVIVAGRRGGETRLAACVVPSASRVDVNGTVRRQLDVRKASFAPLEVAVGETGMEYGGITPIGLPADWPLLVDASLVDLPHVLLGSGRRRGKLIMPGKALSQLTGAEAVEGLGR
ncbi:YbaK/EbsC family protein [Streptomyces litchfieldiae]|uniref:YbaK/EbsC family protein n=1 Tax=Streptomyces litchfieldiae TaxID=3075543 RepID=A0ABU2MQI3_9ACTN|nr:YbaK/EbsC family protein [Streptomyces sp. DSM 44938]MDT0343871.1 YbaK/EbsC family protein [Streptomyces sp. DSM 44938]